MNIFEVIAGKTITLNRLYGGNFPNRYEDFWDHVRSHELDKELSVSVLPSYKLDMILRSQYGNVEHIDEVSELLNDEQREIVNRYRQDPQLSSKIIVLVNNRIVDGNHRALAAALNKVSINYVDLADLDEQDVTKDLNEFAIVGDDGDDRSERPMLLADVAKIIRAKLGPDWTVEHVGRTEQPGYKFIPKDKTKHGMAKIWCLVDWDKVGEYPTYNTILYSFQNENGRLMAHGKQTERAKPKTVVNALKTANLILSNTEGALKDTIDEAKKRKSKSKKNRTQRSITTGWWGGYYGDNSSGGDGGGGE